MTPRGVQPIITGLDVTLSRGFVLQMVNPQAVPSSQLADLVALAAHKYDAGQLVEAEQAYRRILEIRPDLAEAHHNLAKSLERQGRLDEAVLHYQRAGAGY